MKEKYDKNKIKKMVNNFLLTHEDDFDGYSDFQQINKKSKKFKDENKDINRGRKLNKRTYR